LAYKKTKKDILLEAEQLEVAAKLKWYRDLLTYAEMGEQMTTILWKTSEKKFSAPMFMYSPLKGTSWTFRMGQLPLDFAYRIHPKLEIIPWCPH
jgi:(p)ppGpp synthase/HD superfamily hydrolase